MSVKFDSSGSPRFSLVAALLTILRYFHWGWAFRFTRQSLLGAVFSYVPARALVGFALGAVVGWFSKGLAVRVFDGITEKPRR